MKKIVSLLFYFVILSIFVSNACRVFAEEIPLVTSIEVKGLKRIEEAAVKSKITQKVGAPLVGDAITNDIKSIYKMGYFDDVKVEMEPFEGGVKLLYLIKEKPTVVRIDFQGNEELDDSKLKDNITISIGSIADTVLIQDNAEKLHAYYEEEGYWLAKVVPVLKKISEDDIALTFQIEEGPKVKIKEIVIEGNKGVSAKDIKKVMKTSEWWLFSFLTSSGYYKKEDMNSDIEKIRDLYFNHGYIKIAVAEPKIQITEDKTGMVIIITVSEGEQYKISSVEIAGNKAFSESELRAKIESSPENIFSKSVLRKDVAALNEMHSEKGYALVNVYPDVVPDDASKQVRITFKIDEGDIYHVGRIEILGNIKTLDKVIRREVRLDEGDLFNSTLLRRSYERINNLNYFDNVEIQPRPKIDEKLVNIDVNVKERSTGMFTVGAGYSSTDKFIGSLDVTLGNLFGRGQYMKLKGEFGSSSTTYELSFRDPWFLDKPLSFGVSLYKTEKEYTTYDKKATGVDITFGKSLAEYWKGSVSYNLERATVNNIDDDASDIVKEQEGTKITSSITPSVARDTRDYYLDPHRGSKNSLYFTFAGIGGDNKFLKTGIDSLWYFPVSKETTFALRGRYGYSTGLFGESVPLYERFYVGGINTVRGLDYGEAGPRDEENDVIGGTKELIFNTEFIFPLISDIRLKGVVFVDAGRAYDDSADMWDLRYTTGGGIRWISPIGPLRLEWGYNIDRRYDESGSRWEFSFGSFF